MFLLVLALLAIAGAAFAADEACGNGFTICAPSDATTVETPKIGDERFANLYTNILKSSLPSFSTKRTTSIPRDSPSLCCITSLSCLTVADFALPFCYDKFTTNYFLPDNSFGSLASGTYNSSSGDVANLQTGDFTLKDGEQGNIYSSNSASRPNTATLAIPSQWTNSGVGSVVPASGLGQQVTRTLTMTLPGSTVPGTTVAEQISTGVATPGAETITTTIEGTTREAITVSEVVTTVVTTEPMASVSSRPSASPTGENLGERLQISLIPYFILALVLNALIF